MDCKAGAPISQPDWELWPFLTTLHVLAVDYTLLQNRNGTAKRCHRHRWLYQQLEHHVSKAITEEMVPTLFGYLVPPAQLL